HVLWLLLPLTSVAAKDVNDTLLWGAYQPNLYFGLQPRISQSLMTGLFWFGTHDYQSIGERAMSVTRATESPATLGRNMTPRKAAYKLFKMARPEQCNHGGSWAARIKGEPMNPGALHYKPSHPFLIFYFGLEGLGRIDMDTDEEENMGLFLSDWFWLTLYFSRASTETSRFHVRPTLLFCPTFMDLLNPCTKLHYNCAYTVSHFGGACINIMSSSYRDKLDVGEHYDPFYELPAGKMTPSSQCHSGTSNIVFLSMLGLFHHGNCCPSGTYNAQLLWNTVKLIGESTDLPVASSWLKRSNGLPLSGTIAQDPTKFEHALDGKLIMLSKISGPSASTDWIHLFLTSHSFHLLDWINITLERHWMTIIHGDHSIAPILTSHPTIFYHLDLPALRCLHVLNITSFWPISSLHLTEVIFGPFMHDSVPSLLQLKQAFECSVVGAAWLLPGDPGTRLIWQQTMRQQYRRTPTSFCLLLSMLEVPKFLNLMIALGNWEADLHAQETASILLEQLGIPSVASKVETLMIQGLCQPCPPTFFALFTNLKTLQLDFSYGTLLQEYRTAPVDPVTNDPQCLPVLLKLTLVAVSSIHVQELVYVQRLTQQPMLQSLQLLFLENEASEAQTISLDVINFLHEIVHYEI
ncbi:hypothetical protein K438DRAFT_2134519, partial [Mycena galopus ATCC 62051]